MMRTIAIVNQKGLSVRASEISAEGKSIYAHDPSGKVAIAYENMVLEVLK